MFFDTTSLFFTGNGGDTLGQYGKSKDHRSDCKQMVLGMVIDGDGIPVCSEMRPGNTTDVTTLDQVAQRLQSRFGVRRVCLVADAGMISKKMIAAVEARGWFYILGARLRRTKEVRDVMLSDTGAFETVEVAPQRPDPMELQVKEVTVNDTPPCNGTVKAPHKPRRYVVCRNPDQARKDAATRAQILAALESKLRSSGPKSVLANKGYKRYLEAEKGAFAVDLDKARDEERFDGMWVLRTNTELSPVEVALRYKQLWMVEQLFRTAKSLLDTRPIFHKTHATICGHVFCSFLALVLRDELFRRIDSAGVSAEGSVAKFGRSGELSASAGVRGWRMNDFRGRHFGGEIVLWAVRWYCRYAVSYRDLEAMMTERGVAVDHSTIDRWVQRFAPEMEKRLRWQWRRPQSTIWRIDETYVKVRGK